MKVAILGGTGFIGKYLVQELLKKGHQVLLWSRHPEQAAASAILNRGNVTSITDGAKTTNPAKLSFEQWPLVEEGSYKIDALINLAGETINQRWTPAAKEKILASRLDTTRQLIQYMKAGKIETSLFINGSAIGYYGSSLAEEFKEDSAAGDDFLATVVQRWEKEANQAEALGVRLIKLRLGLVLGRDGGALPKMLLPYKMFVGGPLGSGEQWISWIHVQDVAQLIIFALEKEELRGAINATAPHPLSMNQFGKIAAEVLKRPHFLPLPAFVLKTILGEMSDLLLKGQRVYPEKALKHGYRYLFPQLKEALIDINRRDGEA